MLRKENKDFLDVFWKKYPTKEEKKLQDSFSKRNHSQIANRIVKQTNTAIDDIAIVLEKLPDKYREKINIEQGLEVFNSKIIDSLDKNVKLRTGKEQLETGIKMIKDEIHGDELLQAIYEPKLDEISKLVRLLVKSKTRLIEKPRNKQSKPFEEMSLGDYVEKVRKNK